MQVCSQITNYKTESKWSRICQHSEVGKQHPKEAKDLGYNPSNLIY